MDAHAVKQAGGGASCSEALALPSLPQLHGRGSNHDDWRRSDFTGTCTTDCEGGDGGRMHAATAGGGAALGGGAYAKRSPRSHGNMRLHLGACTLLHVSCVRLCFL